MSQSWRRSLLNAGIFCILGLTVGYIQQVPVHAGELSMTVRTSLQGFYVGGDTGRFREDRKTIDQTSGGIEGFSLRDDWIEFTGHALPKYDYGGKLTLFEDKPFSVEASMRQFRAFYDGSNEPWDATRFALSRSFSDQTDDNMYVEWTNGNVETSYQLTDQLNLIGGIEFWGRDGRKTLLRGSRARRTGLDARSIAATRDMEGRSETYYLELPIQISEGYGVTFRQSYEHYSDDHDIKHYRYTTAGALDEDRTFQDYPTFDELQTQLTITAEPTENMLVTGGYLHNRLSNQTERTSTRPTANPNHFTDPNVENLRRSNVLNGGFIWSNAAGVKDLRLSFGMRAEDADTEARGNGFSNTGSTRRDSRSDLDELRFAESIDLVYSGIPRTSFSASADLEQRKLTWNEFFDAGAYEIPANFSGPSTLAYHSRIRFTDQVYTLRVVNRPHRFVKWSLKYRQKDKVRDYTIKNDTSASFYPGVLGDQDQDVNELSAKVDLRCPKGWTTGFQYQHVNDTIGYGNIAEEAQELTRNRYSASVFGPVTEKLTLLVTGMIDRFFIETPTNTVAEDWDPGDGVYDYNGNLYLFNTTANYVLSDRTKLNASYQQTASKGDNKNVLYEFWTGMQYRLSDEQTLDLRYEYFDFDDDRIEGPKFDDYHGHGIYLALTQDF